MDTKTSDKDKFGRIKDIKEDSINVSKALRQRELIIKYDSIIMRYYYSKKLTNQISELHLFDLMNSFPI